MEEKNRVCLWLRSQWRMSLAKSIWDDLTLIGRILLWVPLWLLCWLVLPFLAIGLCVALPITALLDWPLKKLHSIFFQ